MKKRLLLAVLVISSSLFTGAAQARVETHEFASPAEEARYKRFIAEFRCLVCQNQNLADSNAELAQDLRAETYRMIREGASDEQIVGFMVSRYGDFVLYKPPLNTRTAPLWVGPFLLLLLAAAIAGVFVLRQRRARAEPLSNADHERATKLLHGERKP
jgi:cytochrome c-type biogenesis protein CcmH